MSVEPSSPPHTEVEALRAQVRGLAGQLHERHLQLATAQRAAHLGVWSWNIGCDTVQLSESARLILGMEPGKHATSFAEILGRVHPEDVNGLQQIGRAIERGEPAYGYTYRIYGTDGLLRFIRGEGEAEFDERGRIIRLVGTVFDLTAHRQLLASLHESEARLRDRERSSREFFWEIDDGFRFTRISSAADRTPEDHTRALVGRRLWDVPGVCPVHGDWDEFIATLRERRVFSDFEYRACTDAGPVVIAARGHPVYDGHGTFAGYRGTALNVTRRLVAEDAARRAQALLRRAMRMGRLAAWTLDLNTRVVTWSSEVLRLPGRQAKTGVAAKELLQVVHPGSRAVLEACVNDCIVKHKPFKTEISVRGSGRRTFWLRVIGEHVKDSEAGERISGAVQDITQQREAAQRVADLSRRLTQTLENTPEAFVAFDPNWHFTYVNHHAEALLGKPREELLGTYWFDTFPAMRDSAIHQFFAKALAEFRTVEFESRSPHSGRWFQLTAYPSVDGVAVSSRDISEQIAVRLELERTQERHRKLFETSVDAIFQTAPDGSILAANQAACDMFGRSEEEFRRLGRGGAVDTTDPRLPTLLEQRERTGSAKGQLGMVRADGTRFEADVTSAKYTGSDGRVYTNVFVRDATERILAQEQLARWNAELSEQVRTRTAELEAANEQLRSFAYSVAHDLRSPIAAVTAFAEELQSSLGGRCSEREQNHLERIRVAGVRMDEFVEGMLALATVSRKELIIEDVDLAAMAREVASELRERDPARQVRFRIADRATVRGDRRLLRMAVQNLLSNAWKFTSQREVAEIQFECLHQMGTEPTYSVSDNGAGFDMAYAEKLFAPFQRLHGYAEFPGSGIGLSNVQRVVLRHGGRIWANGEVGQGATFFFTLAQL